jgi:hypothetical protein
VRGATFRETTKKKELISMPGTILCAVTDTDEGRQALARAAELTERLRLRLVLAHVAEGIPSGDGGLDGDESVTMKGDREGAARLLDRLAAEHAVADDAERRVAVGHAPSLLGQWPPRRPRI